MIYYYICDSCGQVKELNFDPDQYVIFCDNPIHSSPVPLRIVVPEDDVTQLQPLIKKERGCLSDAMYIFMAGMVYLILLGILGVVLIEIIKFWVWIW